MGLFFIFNFFYEKVGILLNYVVYLHSKLNTKYTKLIQNKAKNRLTFLEFFVYLR